VDVQRLEKAVQTAQCTAIHEGLNF
jgi:hypothetical protein